MNKLNMPAGLAICMIGVALQISASQSQSLPWQREMSLREAAQSVVLESTLNPTNPQPDYFGAPFGGPAMSINNLKMRTTIWGPPDRIPISLTKNNVWDRRLHEFPVPTLQDITEGAFAPTNKNYVGVAGRSLRPVDLGWLRKEGGSYDPYRFYAASHFVGWEDVILGDPLCSPYFGKSNYNNITTKQ